MDAKGAVIAALVTVAVGAGAGLGYVGYDGYATKSAIQDGGDELISAYDKKVASYVSQNPTDADTWNDDDSNNSTSNKDDSADEKESNSTDNKSEEDSSRDDDGKHKSIFDGLHFDKAGASEEDGSRDTDPSENQNKDKDADGNGDASSSTDSSSNGDSSTTTSNGGTVDENGIIHNPDGSETWDPSAEYDTQIENFSDEDIENIDADLGQLAKVVVGHIRSSAINLNLPLFEGVSEEKMSYGGCTLKEGQELDMNGNFAVAGHNLHTVRNVLFSQVPRLTAGDIVEIDYHAKKAKYKVTSITIISPYDTEKIKDSEIEKASNKHMLSIITCTNDVKNRYLIRGEQISLSENK